MNARSRGNLYRMIALVALLSLLPLGSAGAAGSEPPPPAAPFGETMVESEGAEAPLFALGSPPVGDSFQAGGDRLVAMQRFDGGWAWPLEDLSDDPSPLNTIAPIGKGLAKAFEHTGDPAMYAALQDLGALLLSKEGDGTYSPGDGYLAAQLDGVFGGTQYRDSVMAGYYTPLALSTYERFHQYPLPGHWNIDNPMGTAEYIAQIRAGRSGTQANMAAWDLGLGLVGAASAGVTGSELNLWIEATKAEINELDGDSYYDVIGLAGGLYGLAYVNEEFDPTAGEHSAAWDLDGLAQILISYQLDSGGFTWNSLYQGEGEDNETTQETAYAILALNQMSRREDPPSMAYLPSVIFASDWLYSLQANSGTGGWLHWAAGDEYNAITGEALWALDAGYPVGDVWVCQIGNCGHPEAFYNTIQEGVDNVNLGGTVHVLADDDEDYGLNVPYTEQVIIARSLQLYGAGAANTTIAAPGTLPAASQQNSAIVIVEDGAGVEITGFTVTGPGPSTSGSIRAGIYVRDDAYANIHDNIIADIRDNVLPLSGAQNGVGILVGRQFWSTSGTATIANNVFTGYQKGGIVVDNVGSDATITNNTLTGIGTTDITAQNGIQIGRGATATLSGNTVTLHSYYDATDPLYSWGASGILLYQAGAVTFTGTNTATGNDQNLSIVDGTDLDLDAMVLGGSPAPAGTGMDIWNEGPGNIDATAATFTGAVTCADIEDRVYHKLDDVSLGLATWLDDTVCVTQDSGSIQRGIDASSADGTILVFPGNYDETASNRILLGGATSSGTFPYQFGLFFPIDKPGLTVKGVDATQVDLTDPEDVDLPYVTTHATNNFGPSNFWVEGADVTIQGLRQGPNASGENKSIEVVGDNFTLRYFKSDLPDGGGSVYINDWLYSGGVSTVESFHIDHSNFDDGTQVGVFSGAGVSGDVNGRTITNNSFNFDPLLDVNWPAVSFSGTVPAVAWFKDPVGGAVITGNSFSGSTSYIRSRGVVEESDFDWTSYWNDNTFDKKVIAVLSSTPPLQPRAYAYGDFTNVKIIGAVIQPEVDHAMAGDTVLVGAGTYPERLTIDEGINLTGAGATFGSSLVATGSTIDGSSFGSAPSCGNVIDITGLTGDTTVEGFDILTGDYNSGIHFSGGTDSAGHIYVKNNHIIGTNNSLCTPNTYQYGVIGGYLDVRSLVVTGNEISDTYDNSILAELQMGPTDISGNTFNGGFPSVFYMTYDGHDVAGAQNVTGNTFDMSAAEAASGAAGVGVNPSTFYVTTDRRTGKYADFEISGNTFTGLADVSVKAISVGENSLDGTSGGFDSLQIFGNTISGTDGKGIQFFGHVTGASVYNNVITGLYQGLKMFSYESSFWPAANDISCNQVSGASDKLVYWDGSGTLTVEDNWWGSASGPTPSLMSLNVDYTPWLPVPTCGGGTTTHLISGNAGIANAVLSYNAGGPQTANADGSGSYSFSVPEGWSGEVIPSKAGTSFTPPLRSYTNVTVDQVNQDFTSRPKLFADVPVSGKEWMEPWIEAFYYAGVTTGCGTGPLIYCPESNVTRAEMAVFVLRAKHGAGYTPPAASGFFSDVPVTGKEWMAPWIDQFYREGLTIGCGGGNYCPENNVTRAEMAVFVLRALHGGDYAPPPASGVFADVPVTGKEWMEPWIIQFYNEGITTGCGGGNYCPENSVTRAEMAVFIGRAYDLYP